MIHRTKLIKALSLGLLLDIVPDGSLYIVPIHRNRFFQGTFMRTSIFERLQRASSCQQVT